MRLLMILATINYGKVQVTQAWEVCNNADGIPCVLLNDKPDNIIGIHLDKQLIKKMEQGHEPKLQYTGILSVADAIRL